MAGPGAREIGVGRQDRARGCRTWACHPCWRRSLTGASDRHTGRPARHPEDRPRRHCPRGRDRRGTQWRSGSSSRFRLTRSDRELGGVGASRSPLPATRRARYWRHYHDIYGTRYDILARLQPTSGNQRRTRTASRGRASIDPHHLLADRVSRWGTGASHRQGSANHTRHNSRCTSLHYCAFSLTSSPPFPTGCRSSHWKAPCSRRACPFHTIEPRRPR